MENHWAPGILGVKRTGHCPPLSPGAQRRKVGSSARAQQRLPVPRAWLPGGPHAGIQTGAFGRAHPAGALTLASFVTGRQSGCAAVTRGRELGGQHGGGYCWSGTQLGFFRLCQGLTQSSGSANSGDMNLSKSRRPPVVGKRKRATG